MRAVTGLARSLQMRTTAEGVEKEAQLVQVRDLGCTEMQGHLFSAAIPARELMRFMTATLNRRHVA